MDASFRLGCRRSLRTRTPSDDAAPKAAPGLNRRRRISVRRWSPGCGRRHGVERCRRSRRCWTIRIEPSARRRARDGRKAPQRAGRRNEIAALRAAAPSCCAATGRDCSALHTVRPPQRRTSDAPAPLDPPRGRDASEVAPTRDCMAGHDDRPTRAAPRAVIDHGAARLLETAAPTAARASVALRRPFGGGRRRLAGRRPPGRRRRTTRRRTRRRTIRRRTSADGFVIDLLRDVARGGGGSAPLRRRAPDIAWLSLVAWRAGAASNASSCAPTPPGTRRQRRRGDRSCGRRRRRAPCGIGWSTWRQTTPTRRRCGACGVTPQTASSSSITRTACA